MRRFAAALGCVVGFAASGCALHTTHAVKQRTTLGYTDHQLFAMMHHDAPLRVAGASTGLYEYAGRLAGKACGVDVAFDAEYHGSELRLVGIVKDMAQAANGEWLHADKPAWVTVRDHEAAGRLVRTIEGTIGGDDVPELSALHDPG